MLFGQDQDMVLSGEWPYERRCLSAPSSVISVSGESFLFV